MKSFRWLFTTMAVATAFCFPAIALEAPSEVQETTFCSATTCSNPVGAFTHTFVDVPGNEELQGSKCPTNPPEPFYCLRSCACSEQELPDTDGFDVDNVPNITIDQFGDMWYVSLFTSTTLDPWCREQMPSIQVDSLLVRRYNSNGTLDTGWFPSPNGLVLPLPSDITNTSVAIRGVTVDSSQNLYVATSSFNSPSEVEIQKFTSSGAVATGFGTSGIKKIVSSDFSSLLTFPNQTLNNGLKWTSQGSSQRLMLIGAQQPAGGPSTHWGAWMVSMNASSGVYDTTFGEYHGAEHWESGTFSGAFVQAKDVSLFNGTQQMVVVLANSAGGGGTSFFILRTVIASTTCSSPTTCLDPTHPLFSVPYDNSGTDAGEAFAITASNTTSHMIVLTARHTSGGVSYAEVYRIGDTTGTLDTTFSSDGRVQITTLNGSTTPLNFAESNMRAIEASNGTVFVSDGLPDIPTVYQYGINTSGVVLKLTNAGVRDTTFGTSNGELLLTNCNPIQTVSDERVMGSFTPQIAIGCSAYTEADGGQDNDWCQVE